MSFMEMLGASSAHPLPAAGEDGGGSETGSTRGSRGGHSSQGAGVGCGAPAGCAVAAGHGPTASCGAGGSRGAASPHPPAAQPYQAPRLTSQTSKSAGASATGGRGRVREGALDSYGTLAEEDDGVEEVLGSGTHALYIDRLLCCKWFLFLGL